MRYGLLIAFILSGAACKAAPDCTELLKARSEARMRLENDLASARGGDHYSEASISYDRDEVRRAERRYDEACLK